MAQRNLLQGLGTLTELAKVLRTRRGIISKLEAGRYHGNLKLLNLLQAAYQVDSLYIIYPG